MKAPSRRRCGRWGGLGPSEPEREFFIDSLLIRIHFIIVMIRWTGLAPWEFDFPLPITPQQAPHVDDGGTAIDEGNITEAMRARVAARHGFDVGPYQIVPTTEVSVLS